MHILKPYNDIIVIKLTNTLVQGMNKKKIECGVKFMSKLDVFH